MTKREKIIKAVKEVNNDFTINFKENKNFLNLYPYSYEMKMRVKGVSYKDILEEVKEFITVYLEVI